MKTNLNMTPALYIGLDVHKEKTSVALADPGAKGEIRSHGEVATTQIALERLIRRISKNREIPLSRISVCYEAGGCGRWIARMLLKMKVPRTVIGQIDQLDARIARYEDHMKHLYADWRHKPIVDAVMGSRASR